MTDGKVTVDDREVIVALANLSFKKMNSAYNKAMKKSLEPIVKQTKTNLRQSGIKNVNKPYISKRTGKKYISMQQGVVTSVDTRDEDDAYGKVHIMKEFRLKWFEKGTALRKTVKGSSRGSITPKWFFKSAFMTRGKEAINSLDDNIRESIMKAWERR